MPRAAALLVALVLSAVSVQSTTAQVRPPSVEGWLVASIDTAPNRVTPGVLQVYGDLLRHRALDGALNWEFDLRNVESVATKAIGSPDHRVMVIEITGRDERGIVTRRLTELNDDLTYRLPALLLNVLNLKLQRLNTARVTASRR